MAKAIEDRLNDALQTAGIRELKIRYVPKKKGYPREWWWAVDALPDYHKLHGADDPDRPVATFHVASLDEIPALLATLAGQATP